MDRSRMVIEPDLGRKKSRRGVIQQRNCIGEACFSFTRESNKEKPPSHDVRIFKPANCQPIFVRRGELVHYLENAFVARLDAQQGPGTTRSEEHTSELQSR